MSRFIDENFHQEITDQKYRRTSVLGLEFLFLAGTMGDIFFGGGYLIDN